jgi:hypothetical protein
MPRDQRQLLAVGRGLGVRFGEAYRRVGGRLAVRRDRHLPAARARELALKLGTEGIELGLQRRREPHPLLRRNVAVEEAKLDEQAHDSAAADLGRETRNLCREYG